MSVEKDELNRKLDALLHQVLTDEADRVTPDPDALASIRARIADGDTDEAQRLVSDDAVAGKDEQLPGAGPSGSGWLLAAAALVVALIAIGVIVKALVPESGGGGGASSGSAQTAAAGSTATSSATAASSGPADSSRTTGPHADVTPEQQEQSEAPVNVPVTSYQAGTPHIAVHATPGVRIAWAVQAENTTQVAAGSVLTGSTGTKRGVATIITTLPAGEYQLVLTPAGGTPVTVALSIL